MDAQQAVTASKTSSNDLHPKNVSFCPAADNSSESSPIADDLTAQLANPLPRYLSKYVFIEFTISGSNFSFFNKFTVLKNVLVQLCII